MWLVQVIEVGTGKLLEEAYGSDRSKVEAQYKALQVKYPNDNVCFDYNS